MNLIAEFKEVFGLKPTKVTELENRYLIEWNVKKGTAYATILYDELESCEFRYGVFVEKNNFNKGIKPAKTLEDAFELIM